MPTKLQVMSIIIHLVTQFINNQLSEYSRMHTNAILGINSCKPVKECQGNAVSLMTPILIPCMLQSQIN